VRAAVSEKFGISGNAMNRKSLRAALAALVLGWSTTLVFAQQLGTAEEARAMLDRAIAALKSKRA